MRIHLSDIPQDGKTFSWTRETGELNQLLSDLIQNYAYKAEFFIRPINSRDFEMTGTIVTKAPEQCSRCGIDFPFEIQKSFHEILIPHQPEERTGRYKRVNHLSDAPDQGPGSVEYDASMNLDMGEYIHETVAIAIPFNPAPVETDKGDCGFCGDKVRGRSFGYNETMPGEQVKNPFTVLKNLKLQ